MGERLYDPQTGRFLQVDPVPDGSLNAYDYAGQDPINIFDLTGQCFICSAFGWAVNEVSHHWRGLVSIAAGVGCVATEGLTCAIMSGAAAILENVRRGRSGKWHANLEGMGMDLAVLMLAWKVDDVSFGQLKEIYKVKDVAELPRSLRILVRSIQGAHFNVGAFLLHKMYDR